MVNSLSAQSKNLNKWPLVELGQILELKYGKGLKEADRKGGSIPVFGSGGIVGFHDAPLVSGPGVVVGRKGNVGATYWSEADFYPIDTTYFVETQQDLRFIYYLLETLTFESSHAAVPGLSKEAAYAMKILLPRLEEQRMISATLGRFDLLIDNIRRRIEILEETARLLYREWFVNFRYPGHEDVPLVDSELGPIPEGWSVKAMEDVVEILGGGTPSRKVDDYWHDGDVPWYTPTDLTKERSMYSNSPQELISTLGLEKSSARLFPAGAVMMTSRATIGEVAIATREACTNQGFITCVPRPPISDLFIYFWLSTNSGLLVSLANGATFLELPKKTFRQIKIVVPSVAVLDDFEDIVRPLGELTKNLQREQEALQSARDLLLPRLVSGDLDVADLDLEMVG